MNHEDSIQQRAEMRRGEHPNRTYDAVPLPPLIGTPGPRRTGHTPQFEAMWDYVFSHGLQTVTPAAGALVTLEERSTGRQWSGQSLQEAIDKHKEDGNEPDGDRDEVIRRFAKARDDIGGDHRAWEVSLVGGEEKVRMSLRAYEGIARIITELREGQK